MAELGLTKTWEYLAANTIERISPFMADNITSRIFLLHVLDTKGMKQPVRGGLNLVFRVLKELPSGQNYSDLGVLTPSRANPDTVAIYEWKQSAVPVQISGLDMIKNSGSDAAIADVLTHFIEVAQLSMRNHIGGTEGIFSTHDESNAGFTGLQNLITQASGSAPTTGTAGNLNRATFTFWRNQVVNVSSDFSANGYAGMQNLYTQTQRGDETTDIIIGTRSFYLNFLQNATGTLRYNLPLTANAGNLDVGFSNITFLGALMGHDDACPANTVYFLNSKYVHYIVHPQREMALGPMTMTPTLDALTGYVLHAGNLCISNMARQGLLANADTN